VLDGIELMRQIKTDEDVLHSTAELCLNLWYFVDDSGIVVRIAGKAYALRGSDEEKLVALHLMAGTDHLTATQGKIPEHFIIHTEHGELKGAAPVNLLYDNEANAYGPLIDQIERELPKGIRSVDGNYEQFSIKIPQQPLIVTTVVYEREDGELVARVGKRN
jgi:hypothetical protein